ncbi:MAG: hypothetical protein HPY50_15615 [Firmicutes bacterium]|nr:hypothetical protein [Bacillota bacterium]
MPFSAEPDYYSIVIGVLAGVLARFYLLRVDYRQYPSYPHGYISHLFLGLVAAGLGAVAIPALLKKDYVAVTFLALAAQQFREIRSMERETLMQLDRTELVPRGSDYIEGIARVFEARNYIVMGVALVVSATVHFSQPVYGVVVALVAIFAASWMIPGELVGDIARVELAEIEFQGPLMVIGGVVMMNVGLIQHREKILKEGLGAVIHPNDDNARATLDNIGQRQAIMHVAASLLGTKREISEQEFSPLARKHIDTGCLSIFLLPNEPDRELLPIAIRRTPLLESSKRKPLSTQVGRKAAD